jgi:hypothetical protein
VCLAHGERRHLADCWAQPPSHLHDAGGGGGLGCGCQAIAPSEGGSAVAGASRVVSL